MEPSLGVSGVLPSTDEQLELDSDAGEFVVPSEFDGEVESTLGNSGVLPVTVEEEVDLASGFARTSLQEVADEDDE